MAKGESDMTRVLGIYQVLCLLCIGRLGDLVTMLTGYTITNSQCEACGYTRDLAITRKT